MIHCRLPTGTPSCSLIDGRATLTIVVSMKSRKPARQTSASVSLPRRVDRNEVLAVGVCIRASGSAAHRGVYPQDERLEVRMDTSVRMLPRTPRTGVCGGTAARRRWAPTRALGDRPWQPPGFGEGV